MTDYNEFLELAGWARATIPHLSEDSANSKYYERIAQILEGVPQLILAATRMRDLLTVDGEPPSIEMPEGADPQQFVEAFDSLVKAIRVITPGRAHLSSGKDD